MLAFLFSTSNKKKELYDKCGSSGKKLAPVPMRGNKGTNNMADEDIDMENFDERAETASDFAADDDNDKVKA